MITSDLIRQRARELGFDLCGIAPAARLPELTRLHDWLDKGYAGDMLYLHKSADTRSDIRKFLPSARSVIVTGTVYYAEVGRAAVEGATDSQVPSATSASRASYDVRIGADGDAPSDRVEIARYAWGEDYHAVLAERLQRLVDWLRERCEEPFDAAIFVDKHHVQERVFARHAGLGWIAKNTCLINRDVGSWIFLSGVATSLELVPDSPVDEQCGNCTLCLDACPTGALVDAYELDATRCISYLTIELKGAIPEHQRAGIGQHVFGCDICQEVCPWNLSPLATLDPAWAPRSGRATARAAELWQRDDQQLSALTRHSAMLRTTLSRLRRNLAVALGNSGDPAMIDVLDRPGRGVRRAAQSAETPLVQEHVRWAKARLSAEVDRTQKA